MARRPALPRAGPGQTLNCDVTTCEGGVDDPLARQLRQDSPFPAGRVPAKELRVESL